MNLKHLIVANLGLDLHMGFRVHREIREIEILEVFLRIERDKAVNGDLVADDLEIGEVRRAVPVLDHIETDLGILARGLGPTHAAEQKLGFGQVGLHAHAAGPFDLLSRLNPLHEQGERGRPLHQMIDLDAELLAQGRIQGRGDGDRRLRFVRRIKHAAPVDIRRHVLDHDLAGGADALIGEIDVERAAFDAHVSHEICGNGVLEAGDAAHLDFLEVEIRLEGHRQDELAGGGPAEEVGLQADLLNVAERLVIQELHDRGGGRGRLVGDDALLGILAQVGDVEAPLAERNFASFRNDNLRGRNVDRELRARDRQLPVAGHHRRHLGNVGDAHAGKVELDVDGPFRRRGALLNGIKGAGGERDVEPAAQNLAAGGALQHPGARLAGQEFGPKLLQRVHGHGADLARNIDRGRSRRSADHGAGHRDLRVSGTNDETGERHTAVFGRQAARRRPLVDLGGTEPEFFDPEHGIVGPHGEVPGDDLVVLAAHRGERAAEGRLALSPTQRRRRDLDDIPPLQITNGDIAVVDPHRCIAVPRRGDLPRRQPHFRLA